MTYWYGSNNEFPSGQYTLGQAYFHSGGIALILFCKFLCPIIYFDPQTPLKPNVIVSAFNKALFDCHQVTFNPSFNNLQIVIRPIGKLLFQCIFISR
jgi:hypothetical protein